MKGFPTTNGLSGGALKKVDTVKVSETSQQKRWVSLSLWWLWCIRQKLCSPLICRVLVASVQPNLRANRTRSASKKLQIKALGFTQSLVNVVSLEKVVFLCYSHVFGGIRSTQPTS